MKKNNYILRLLVIFSSIILTFIFSYNNKEVKIVSSGKKITNFRGGLTETSENEIPNTLNILNDYKNNKTNNHEDKHFLKVAFNDSDINRLKEIMSTHQELLKGAREETRSIKLDTKKHNDEYIQKLKEYFQCKLSNEKEGTLNILVGYLYIEKKADELFSEGSESSYDFYIEKEKMYFCYNTKDTKEPADSSNRFSTIARRVKDRVEYMSLMYYLSDYDSIEKEKYAQGIILEISNACEWKNYWQCTGFLDTAELSYAVSLGYDTIYDKLDDNQKTKIEKSLINSMILYCREQNSKNFNNTSNWNQVCNSGIGITAITLLDKTKKIYIQETELENYELLKREDSENPYKYITDSDIKKIIRNEKLIQTEDNGDEYILLEDLCAAIIEKTLMQLPRVLNDMYEDGSYPEGPTYFSYGMKYFNLYLSTIDNALNNIYNLLDCNIDLNNIILYPIYVSNNLNEKFNYSDSQVNADPGANIFWLANRCASRNIENGLSSDTTKALYCWRKKTAIKWNFYGLIWYNSDYDVDEDDIDYDEIFNKNIYQNENIDLDKIGIVTYRGDFEDKKSIFVGLNGIANNKNHPNLDLGSFIFDVFGTRWIDDLGSEEYTTNYFNTSYWRWHYYKTRAEAHSTIVINPQMSEDELRKVKEGYYEGEKYVDADQWISAFAKFEKFNSNDNSSIAVVDLSEAYNKNNNNDRQSTSNENTVKRGIKLFNSKKYMLLQDEVELKNINDYYSFLNVSDAVQSIDISNDGKVATLTDKKENKVKLILDCTDTRAKFKSMEKKPLNEFLIKENASQMFESKYNLSNASKNKLAVYIDNRKENDEDLYLNMTMKIWFIPLYDDESSSINYKSEALLSEWYIPDKPIIEVKNGNNSIENGEVASGNATIKLSKNRDEEIVKYSLDDGKNWNEYIGNIIIPKSGKYTILTKAEDKNGTESDISEFSFEIMDANGSDEKDDTKAIQEALNKAKEELINKTDGQIEVYIPSGTYYISERLNIYSNTKLLLDDNATIIYSTAKTAMLIARHLNENGEICTGSNCNHGGYTQWKNITIEGGTWNFNNDGSSNLNGLIFAHGENLTVKNTTLINSAGHALNPSCSKDVTIENVTIKDQISSEPAKANDTNEVIHLDSASTGEPGSYPLDGTPVKNVKIENCIFDNILSGIGAHVNYKEENYMGDGIVIRNNKFNNVKCYAINLFAHKNVEIYENTAIGMNEDNIISKANEAYGFVQTYFTNANIHNNNVSNFEYTVVNSNKNSKYTVTCDDERKINKYFIITYNSNGGEGTMPTQKFEYDNENNKISKNEFEKKGYKFGGWIAFNNYPESQKYRCTDDWHTQKEIDANNYTKKVFKDEETIQYVSWYHHSEVIMSAKWIKRTNIDVTKKPEKLIYIKNTENLDLSGGVITSTYEDGSTEQISLNDEKIKVNGFDNSKIGKNTIIVEYEGLTTTFDVEIVKQESITSDIYTIDNNEKTITNIDLKTTVSAFKEKIESTTDFQVKDKNGNDLSSSDYIGTECKIITSLGEYTLIVSGDLNGTGDIDVNDLAQAQKINLELTEANRTKLLSGDLNQNGKIDINDLAKLQKIFLEKD